MALYIRADHCQDKTIPILETWLASKGSEYHSLDVILDKNSTLYPGEQSLTVKTDASYQGKCKIQVLQNSFDHCYQLIIQIKKCIQLKNVNQSINENQSIIQSVNSSKCFPERIPSFIYLADFC